MVRNCDFIDKKKKKKDFVDSFILSVCHDESKVMGNCDWSLRSRQCMESLGVVPLTL